MPLTATHQLSRWLPQISSRQTSLKVTRCGSPEPFPFFSPLPSSPPPPSPVLSQSPSTIFKQVSDWLSYLKCNIAKAKKMRKEQKRKNGKGKKFLPSWMHTPVQPLFPGLTGNLVLSCPYSPSIFPTSTPLIRSCIHRNPLCFSKTALPQSPMINHLITKYKEHFAGR